MESAIFNNCCTKPIKLDFQKLSLQFIMAQDDTAQKKTLRLYQMLWSGLTKYLLQMVQVRGKAVEIPSFGVFYPVYGEWSSLANPLCKGPLSVTQE